MNKIFCNVALTLIFSQVSIVGLARADVRSALGDYKRTATANVQQLQTLRDTAASCGLVGRMVAGRMGTSIQAQTAQIAAVVGAVARGPAGKAMVQEKLSVATQGLAELRSSSGMIRNGLSADDPTCRRALAAFERMSSLSQSLPAKLQTIIASLETAL